MGSGLPLRSLVGQAGEAERGADPTEKPGKRTGLEGKSRGLKLRTDIGEGSMKTVGQAGHSNFSGQGGQRRELRRKPSEEPELSKGTELTQRLEQLGRAEQLLPLSSGLLFPAALPGSVTSDLLRRPEAAASACQGGADGLYGGRTYCFLLLFPIERPFHV